MCVVCYLLPHPVQQLVPAVAFAILNYDVMDLNSLSAHFWPGAVYQAWLNMHKPINGKNIQTKNINAALLFLPPFFKSWSKSSETFLVPTEGLFV